MKCWLPNEQNGHFVCSSVLKHPVKAQGVDKTYKSQEVSETQEIHQTLPKPL